METHFHELLKQNINCYIYAYVLSEINRPFRQVGVDKTLEDIANVSPPLNQLPDPMDFDLKGIFLLLMQSYI